MSWRKVLALGGVASVIAVGCKVTVNDGPFDGGSEETGGAAGTGGASTGGASTGGKGGTSTGGASTGGKGGASTGGKAGAGGSDHDAQATVCMPDKTKACDYCIETKCCAEWLDCVNDAVCEDEFSCIQGCIINDGGSFPTVEECAGTCKHDSVGVSSATSGLIGCMRDTGTGDAANTQNCTTECFGREL